MSANPEHNTPPKDRREAGYCSACDGDMRDTVRINNSDCLQKNISFTTYFYLAVVMKL
jgi:hypothetical protein